MNYTILSVLELGEVKKNFNKDGIAVKHTDLGLIPFYHLGLMRFLRELNLDIEPTEKVAECCRSYDRIGPDNAELGQYIIITKKRRGGYHVTLEKNPGNYEVFDIVRDERKIKEKVRMITNVKVECPFAFLCASVLACGTPPCGSKPKKEKYFDGETVSVSNTVKIKILRDAVLLGTEVLGISEDFFGNEYVYYKGSKYLVERPIWGKSYLIKA